MRIGIDARWIFRDLSGIGVYTRGLIGGLGKIDTADDYFIFYNRPFQPELLSLAKFPNMRPVFLPGSPNSPLSQLSSPLKIKQLRLDVFHSPNFFGPALGNVPLVITVHDLIPFMFPHFIPRAKKVRMFPLYRRMVASVSRKAKAIITVSENTKKDLIASFAVEEGKIKVVYNGVSEDFRESASGESGFKKEGGVSPPGEPYFLFVGRFDPYKNIAGLIEAFHPLKRDFPGVKLVVAGRPDDRYPQPLESARRLGLKDSVIFSGYLTEADLKIFYSRARALVLPSFYEGFGLPVLEAFACGCPVITGRVASLPEICQDAAILVDPRSSAELKTAMEKILIQKGLREELISRGYARAKFFTWEKTAEKTAAVYRGFSGA